MVNRIVVGAHYGLRDWIMQRVTAVIMAVYTVGIVLALLLFLLFLQMRGDVAADHDGGDERRLLPVLLGEHVVEHGGWQRAVEQQDALHRFTEREDARERPDGEETVARHLAAADSSLAHLFAFNHLQVATVLLHGSAEQQRHWLTRAARERWFWGNASNGRDLGLQRNAQQALVSVH